MELQPLALDRSPKERIAGMLSKHQFLVNVVIVAIFTFTIRVHAIDLDFPINADPFAYIIKAIEITEGNWIPIETHGIGWSIVLAPFMKLAAFSTMAEKMQVSIIVSIAIEAVTVIPVAFSTREVLNKNWALVSAIFYAIWIPDRVHFMMGGTESIFMFLLTLSIYFVLKAFKNWKFLVPAMAIAGFMVSIRPNGIVIPLVLGACFLFSRIKSGFKERAKHLIASVPCFLAVALPFILLRAWHHGFLDYGANSNLFVDDYVHVWSGEEGPDMITYIMNSSLPELFDRFVINGAGRVGYYFLVYMLSPFLLVPVLVGGLFSIKDQKRRAVILSMIAFLASLIPMFGIIGRLRYMLVLMPLALVVATIGTKEIIDRGSKVLKKVKIPRPALKKPVLFAGIFIVIVATMGFIPGRQKFDETYDQMYRRNLDSMACGNWIATNLHDSRIVFTYQGSSIPFLDLDDTRINGGALGEYYSPSVNITSFTSAYFEDVDGFMTWMEDQRATHVVIGDYMDVQMRPFASEINDTMPQFTLVYSNIDTDIAWKASIYEFHP